MSKRDLKNNISALVGFNPQALSGTSDITGEIIDTKGYSSVMWILSTDDIAVGSLDAQLLIQEGDAANLSDAATVAAADLEGTVAATAIAETDDSVTKKIGYKGSKRYVRSNLTVTTNAGTDVVACTCILGHAASNPVS